MNDSMKVDNQDPAGLADRVRDCWEGNAEAWTVLARAGYDVCRDSCNTPRFFEMLPDVAGLEGLDLGCGEGHNTRLAVRRGARMTAVDHAPTFIAHAMAEEERAPLGIRYRVASATAVPFADRTFDFVMATMSLMDMAEPERAVGEAFRVVRPGGFCQVSILHPCFMTRRFRWLKDENGRKEAVVVGDYFHRSNGDWIEEWIFGASGTASKPYRKFRIPRFTRTLSEWINLFLDAGFRLERLGEPTPSDEMLEKYPTEYDMRIIPYFLHILARKPV